MDSFSVGLNCEEDFVEPRRRIRKSRRHDSEGEVISIIHTFSHRSSCVLTLFSSRIHLFCHLVLPSLSSS